VQTKIEDQQFTFRNSNISEIGKPKFPLI